MPGPARAGAMIYAIDVEGLSSFYQRLLSMSCLHADADHHVIESADFQLLIHAIPPRIAATMTIATPPVPREDTAIKPFFNVGDLARATALARSLRGEVFEQRWHGPGFVACIGCDPGGNVFRLRQW